MGSQSADDVREQHNGEGTPRPVATTQQPPASDITWWDESSDIDPKTFPTGDGVGDEAVAHAYASNETWKLLNDVRMFIEREYADPAVAPDGEWMAKEARPIHDRLCTARGRRSKC